MTRHDVFVLGGHGAVAGLFIVAMAAKLRAGAIDHLADDPAGLASASAASATGGADGGSSVCDISLRPARFSARRGGVRTPTEFASHI